MSYADTHAHKIVTALRQITPDLTTKDAAVITAARLLETKLMDMKVYTCTDFEGHWPVGAAAVVAAENPIEALNLLNGRLAEHGLPSLQDPKKLVPFDTSYPSTVVLADGDY